MTDGFAGVAGVMVVLWEKSVVRVDVGPVCITPEQANWRYSLGVTCLSFSITNGVRSAAYHPCIHCVFIQCSCYVQPTRDAVCSFYTKTPTASVIQLVYGQECNHHCGFAGLPPQPGCKEGGAVVCFFSAG